LNDCLSNYNPISNNEPLLPFIFPETAKFSLTLYMIDSFSDGLSIGRLETSLELNN